MKRANILFLTLSVSIISACANSPPPSIQVTADKHYGLVGIDISKYQGTVNFKSVRAAGVRYIFVRATEGNTYQDPDFKSNFASARANGLAVSAYHFYETNDAPDTQLENYTSLVSLHPGDLPPVIDIEKLHNQDQSDLTENLKTFLSGLESHYKVKPIIYSGRNFSNAYLTEFGDYPLWLAEYGVDIPRLPTGWNDWTFWQWSQSSTIKGIDGTVDADRFNGDESQFLDLLIK